VPAGQAATQDCLLAAVYGDWEVQGMQAAPLAEVPAGQAVTQAVAPAPLNEPGAQATQVVAPLGRYLPASHLTVVDPGVAAAAVDAKAWGRRRRSKRMC